MIAASRCGTRTLRKASSTLTVSVMARTAPSSSATGERQADLPGRDGGGGEERHGHARHGQGQDRPGGLAQAGGVGRQRPLEDQDRQEHHQHDAGVHRRLGQHLEQHEHQADDDQRDVVGHADPPRHDRHAGADREHGQQLFEVLTHGRAAAGDNASTPTLYVMGTDRPPRRGEGPAVSARGAALESAPRARHGPRVVDAAQPAAGRGA